MVLYLLSDVSNHLQTSFHLLIIFQPSSSDLINCSLVRVLCGGGDRGDGDERAVLADDLLRDAAHAPRLHLPRTLVGARRQGELVHERFLSQIRITRHFLGIFEKN